MKDHVHFVIIFILLHFDHYRPTLTTWFYYGFGILSKVHYSMGDDFRDCWKSLAVISDVFVQCNVKVIVFLH